MINEIFRFCFEKRMLFIVVTILVVIFGYYSWTQLSIEAYPELSDVTAQVTTQVPGLAAEEIEQQITIPLERQLATTQELVSMRSSSTFGLSLITMVFKDGADDYWVRQRVQNALGQVTLPPGVTPSLDPVSGPAGEIYRYTLQSNSKNLMQLSEIQRWIVIPALQQVPGVINVDNFGGFTKEFQLELDPVQLLHYGVSVNQVTTAISNNTSNAGGGRITRGEQSYIVRGVRRTMACRCWCATWASFATDIRCARAFWARTTTPTPSKASSTCSSTKTLRSCSMGFMPRWPRSTSSSPRKTCKSCRTSIATTW